MRVTIVPEDQCVIVDGDMLSGLSLPATTNIHAIQWHGTAGIIERQIGPAERFTDESVIAPFVAVWQARRDEIDNPPQPPAPTMPELQALRRAEVKRLRDKKETEGFSYLGKVFDSDERSVQRITSEALTAQVFGPAFSIEWTAADNSSVTLDQAAMLGMPAALAARAGALHSYAKGLKQQIENAVYAELEVMDVSQGWPAL